MKAAGIQRRTLLASLLAGCAKAPTELQGGWVGTHPERGHRLRDPAPAWDGPLHTAQVVVVGAGIAGLACARTLTRQGVDDVAVLDLESDAGGNSRAHQLAGNACPLGAHYLPVPGPAAEEVSTLLEELGLSRQQFGRTVWNERFLCHSPQERLYVDGAWSDGLLPPPDDAEALAQYRHFGTLVSRAQHDLGFAMPTRRAPWGEDHRRLDASTYADWLQTQGLTHPRLRWYLDYCCRDDFGASADQVSAWAGLHYFASRHGFHAPGDESTEREPVLTWPEGNGWLSQRLAEALHGRLHLDRIVLQVREERHRIELLAWNALEGRPERWQARHLVLATPLFVSRRLVDRPALREAVTQLRYAPWLTANLLLREPLLDRPGAPMSWDNVRYGSQALGYVNARHQSLDPTPRPPILTAYLALPQDRRRELLERDWQPWAAEVLSELALMHPDLPGKLARIDLCRFGHAMSIPVPGLRSSAALQALGQPQGRIAFAHSDLAGYSVFEEAYTAGVQAASRLSRASRASRS